MQVERLRFLETDQVEEAAEKFGTPVFVYDETTMREQAQEALAFPAPYGLDVRYAMKANPNSHIIRVFDEEGICIDASSEHEVRRALRAGVEGSRILLTSQQFPDRADDLVDAGVEFNACSLNQLRRFGEAFPGSDVSVRINPGLGSGHSNKTNTGGPASPFGIWHEYVPEIQRIADRHGLRVKRVHTHIGSGNDPEVWTRAAEISADQVHHFEEAEILNLGGGFKVARMGYEIATDLQKVGEPVARTLERFADETGRELRLEIEPGTFLMANAGSLITTVHDKKDTGEGGYQFLMIDSGMTEILRPTLYGAQHPIVVVGKNGEHDKYVVAGHCCESSDMQTPEAGIPDALEPRLTGLADVGDRLVLEGVGAYCAYMSAQNYNSFPLAPEAMLTTEGELVEICRRETFDEMLQLETPLPPKM